MPKLAFEPSILTIDISRPGNRPDQIDGLALSCWWRLEQNAETGMALRFGTLDNMAIAKLDTLEGTQVSSRVSGGKSAWGGLQIEKINLQGRVLREFLEITEAHNAMNHVPNQPPRDILFMDEAEFNQQMAKYEVA
jgi:hypothetical protein